MTRTLLGIAGLYALAVVCEHQLMTSDREHLPTLIWYIWALEIAGLLLFLAAWIRREEDRFPTASYGGRTLSRRTVRRVWLGIVLACSMISAGSPQTYYRHVGGEGRQRHEFISSIVSYRVIEIDGEIVDDSRSASLPVLFVLSLYFYRRCVVKFDPVLGEPSSVGNKAPPTEDIYYKNRLT